MIDELLLKPLSACKILQYLKNGDINKNQLAMVLKKQTGNMTAPLDHLEERGYIRKEECGKQKMISLTKRGKLILFAIENMSDIFDIEDEEDIDQALREHIVFRTNLLRIIDGDLFNREVVNDINPSASKSVKLRSLVVTILPNRRFTVDEVLHSYSEIFLCDGMNKKNVSTCFNRFQDAKNGNYIRGFKMVENGIYMIER